jgi:hypothetical protein
MPFDQPDEVPLGVTTQCRFAEMRIFGEKTLGRYFEIGEVAAPAPRYEYLGARVVPRLEQQHSLAALPGGYRAH